MEYVIVEFPERREVFIANQSQGDNRDPVSGVYRVLMVGDGRHTFHLGGPPNYTPLSQTVVVVNTNPIEPLRVVFKHSTLV